MKKLFFALLTRILYINKKIEFGKNFRCDSIPKFIINNGSVIKIADSVIIRKNVELRSVNSGVLSIGNNCIIDNGARIIASNSEVILKDRVKIGYYSVVNGGGGVIIDEDTSLYGFVYIQTSTHQDKEKNFDKNSQPMFIHKSVKIGKKCLIGAHVSILPGASISDYQMIEFNSVVQ
ncbi:acyltransferase [Flavobacterium aciduliphilum]|uniref:Transferase family hexapeptide repeat protein n=1 Tax=Flavobacterium aciduliphilum TaxID=1101402 RepID=A0A328Y846_9FLAO|nr:hypothetical protein [Flavobacterium aciduliphilum]RAR70251.1 transferase family hexapeptide repeat protein [Flavobacterium aciduliphilum]